MKHPIPLNIKAIDEDSVLRCLGYKQDTLPAPGIGEIIIKLSQEALCLQETRGTFTIVPIRRVDDDKVVTEQGDIMSARLASIARDSSLVAFALVTVGPTIDRKMSESSSLLEGCIWDAIGTVMAETAVDSLLARIREESGLISSLPFSPGYCDWDLSGQKLCFSILDPQTIGIKVLGESLMMTPQKSVSFITCLGQEGFEVNPCRYCSLKNCFMRRGSSSKSFQRTKKHRGPKNIS